jgi:hypothetical protein
MGRMKFLVGILTVIVIFLAAGVAYFYGKSTVNNQVVNTLPTPTSTTTVQPTTAIVVTPGPTATVTPAAKKVNGGGILSFPKYELTIPADWVNTREVPGPDAEKIVLKKGKYEVSILEGGFGGAACLYPGDPDLEGPSGRYEQFVEITTKSNDLLRRSWSGTGGFAICQKTQYGWGAPSLYGHIGITVPDTYTKEMITEIDGILASIKKI